jgi:hypothetical protein
MWIDQPGAPGTMPFLGTDTREVPPPGRPLVRIRPDTVPGRPFTPRASPTV